MAVRRWSGVVGAVALAVVVTVGVTSRAPRTAAAVVPDPVQKSPAATERPTHAPSVVPSAFANSAKPAPLINATRAGTLTSSPWKLLAVSPDGRTLTVMANQGGGCDHPAGIEVVQAAREVELSSLYAKGSPPPGFAYLATPVWTVQLQAPLDTRPLVHPAAEGAAL